MKGLGSGSLGSAVTKMQAMGFDPLEAIITQYNNLCAEIKIQERIRDGDFTRLRADGKARAYSPEFHTGLCEKAVIMADRLMRYGYGRVLEEKDVYAPSVPSLNINLSDGTTTIINPEEDDGDDRPTSDTE